MKKYTLALLLCLMLSSCINRPDSTPDISEPDQISSENKGNETETETTRPVVQFQENPTCCFIGQKAYRDPKIDNLENEVKTLSDQYGETSLKVLPAYEKLATYLHEKELDEHEPGIYMEAMEAHEKAIEIIRTNLGDHHPKLIENYKGKAQALKKRDAQGDKAAAMENFKQALNISKVHFDAHPEYLMQTSLEMAHLYYESGNKPVALKYYNDALRIMKERQAAPKETQALLSKKVLALEKSLY